MAIDCDGLFVTGTDTGVGKTYVAALIAKCLASQGVKVGVYKPAASGCSPNASGALVSEDAIALWNAAGCPGELERVCPQRFALPIAPHLAAKAEGRAIDAVLLRSGLDYWRQRSDVVIVEGAGGLMSPFGEDEFVADLVADFGFPLVVVAANRLGTINATLQTLIAAKSYRRGLGVAGVVLNQTSPSSDEDQSQATNGHELARHCPAFSAPLLATVACGGQFDTAVDWAALARWTVVGGRWSVQSSEHFV